MQLGAPRSWPYCVLVAAQRQEVLGTADGFAHAPQQCLQVFAALHEVDIRGVDDQQVRRGVVEEKVLIGLYDFFDVIVMDGLLARSILLLKALLQHVGRRLQVDHKVRCGHVLPEQVVIPVVNLELLVAQIEAGKQLVFLEDVVGDKRLVGIALYIERGELFVARDQKSELCLKGGAPLSVVKPFQKMIVLRLADALRTKGLSDDPRQRALADSDRAFNCDIAGRLEQVCHGTLRSAEYLSPASVAITMEHDAVESFEGECPKIG